MSLIFGTFTEYVNHTDYTHTHTYTGQGIYRENEETKYQLQYFLLPIYNFTIVNNTIS